MSTCYPLFDTGYTTWKGDVEAYLFRILGHSLRDLGFSERELLARYHHGVSPFSLLEELTRAVAAD
jgi:hypothetical protein